MIKNNFEGEAVFMPTTRDTFVFTQNERRW